MAKFAQWEASNPGPSAPEQNSTPPAQRCKRSSHYTTPQVGGLFRQFPAQTPLDQRWPSLGQSLAGDRQKESRIYSPRPLPTQSTHENDEELGLFNERLQHFEGSWGSAAAPQTYWFPLGATAIVSSLNVVCPFTTVACPLTAICIGIANSGNLERARRGREAGG